MTPKQNVFRAACLLIASLWVLSVLDGAGKWLQQAGVALVVVLWFRYLGQAVLVAIICFLQRKRLRWEVKSVPLQLLRGVLMLCSSITFFTCLQLLPLAEATAINFTAPIFTLVLAPVLLNEVRLPHRWPLVLLSLFGAYLVVRPGAGFNLLGTMFAILTALFFSLYQIATRKAAGDEALISNLFTGCFGALTVTLFLWATGGFSLATVWQSEALLTSRPTTHWVVLAGLGVIATVGHSLQVSAFRRAPANALTPFMYLQIVSALVVGYLLFNQWPDLTSMLGMAIICATGLAGLYLARRVSH
jgi:drug/metabolite transporter (DMT)-like permease